MSYWKIYKRHWSTSTHNKEGYISPMNLVGGAEESNAMYQYNAYLAQGLLPHHTFLDIGCGCLRGGYLTHLYLNDKNFYGLDISKDLLDAAKERAKKPIHLTLNENFNFKDYYPNLTFDYLGLWSVITHLEPEDTIDLIKNLSLVMHNDSICIASIFISSANAIEGTVDKKLYPVSYLNKVLTKHGFNDLEILDDRRKTESQTTIKITKVKA